MLWQLVLILQHTSWSGSSLLKKKKKQQKTKLNLENIVYSFTFDVRGTAICKTLGHQRVLIHQLLWNTDLFVNQKFKFRLLTIFFLDFKKNSKL